MNLNELSNQIAKTIFLATCITMLIASPIPSIGSTKIQRKVLTLFSYLGIRQQWTMFANGTWQYPRRITLHRVLKDSTATEVVLREYPPLFNNSWNILLERFSKIKSNENFIKHFEKFLCKKYSDSTVHKMVLQSKTVKYNAPLCHANSVTFVEEYIDEFKCN